MSLPPELGGLPILFFGGKGGVGKTTLAAATALASADAGARTLLVSTDPAHSTADVLERQLGGEPRPVVGTLWAMEIDPATEVERYITGVKERIAEATPPQMAAEVDRQIEIARVSPGAEESAIFERFSRILEQEAREFERVVFDTAPTGHTLRLLSLPELMTAWIDALIGRRRQARTAARAWRKLAGAAAGSTSEADPVLEVLEARRDRFARARTTLTDPDRTGFVFVVIPERLPILETEKAVAALDRFDVPVAAVWVNRILPSGAEGAFLDRRRERQTEYLAWIERAFGDHPLRRIALREADVVGLDALRALLTD